MELVTDSWIALRGKKAVLEENKATFNELDAENM